MNKKPAKLAYLVFNPAGGSNENLSPVIFLHGITASKEYWNEIPQKVADATKRKAYSLDARNHGDSEYSDDFNFELNVLDLFHFMASMNIPKAILVGHSMGGITSMRAALLKPEKVEMMISEDMYAKKLSQETCDRVSEFTVLRNTLIENMPSNMSENEVIKSILDYVFALPEEMQIIKKTDDIYKMKLPLKRREDGGFDVKYNKEVILRTLGNADEILTDPSGKYEGPAYFLYGVCSPFSVGSEAEHIKKHFPKAEFFPFEETTHYLHMEYPKEFTEKIISLIRSKL